MGTERRSETLDRKKMAKKTTINPSTSRAKQKNSPSLTKAATKRRYQHHRPIHQFMIYKLPFEILVDIFSRVSLHDISQSKLVCKELYNSLKPLFADRIFVNLHCSRIRLNSVMTNPNFLVFATTDRGEYTRFYIAHHGGISLGTSLRASRIHLDSVNRYDNMEIVGSSNGLVCLYNSSTILFHIFNPLTRETLELPKTSELGAFYESYSENSQCGFAFDSITNTYKIILARRSNEVSGTGIAVYTLGSGMWRRLEHSVNCVLARKRPVLLNGGLHWLGYFWGEHLIWLYGIAVMDICTETFRKFKVPSKLLCWDYYKIAEICLVRNCLSIILEDYEYWVIWSLKNYFVEDSWEKKTIVKRQLHGISGYNLSIIGALNNGSLLFRFDTSFYHNENRKFQKITIHGVPPNSDTIDVLPFVGSLISPKTLDGQTRKEHPIKESEEKQLFLLKD
ncbi:hypothetical protein ACHQM5_017929 [Ranunculus cassubicifolius]